MEHLEILDKLCECISDTFEKDLPLYMYSAAIYDVWSKGSELEKNLIDRLVKLWAGELENKMREGYKATRHRPERPERADYYKSFIESRKTYYSDHKGLIAALDLVDTSTEGWDGY